MIEPSELRKYSLFGGLMQEQIDGVFPLMQHESYEAGKDIITEGEKNGRVLFIASGSVAVVKNGLILTEFKKGDTVGEMEVLDMMPSAATVRALENVEVATLTNVAFHSIYKQDAKTFAMIVMNLARDLSRRLRKMDDMVVEESPYHEWS
ncbi:MAG: cyclic nucleotide-binding domain-containing protein [Treponema sp.]|jgi:CRP-like cAMP-binding protein|nr:cyclic nucleotide-binding domain-containing protein [Treponema sp.]